MQTSTEDSKIKTFSLISEIIQICNQCPRLSSTAVEGINNIIQQMSRMNYMDHSLNFSQLQPPSMGRTGINDNQNSSENITYEQFKDLINSACNSPENITLSQNSNENILKICTENPPLFEYLKRYSEEMSKDQSNQI